MSHLPPSGNTQEKSTLNLIYKLCKTLETEAITYCHWKSNAALDRSASGDNDLDLLISRADGQRFTEILYRLGFKKAQSLPEKQLPGVLNFYGYDEKAEKIVHVHAHYQLILGHDATKNYRLPIEKAFLASVIQDDLFKIPAPEFELIVFVIRMVIKHSTWDTILGRQGNLSTTEKQELVYLSDRIDQSQLYSILDQHLPFLEKKLFDDCMQSLQPNCTIRFRIKVGQKLQSRLKANIRRSQSFDVLLKLWRHFFWKVRKRIFRQPMKKYLDNGGAIIAIVGGDGSGKSTSVDELNTWLSKNFATIKVHLGKPPRSWGVIFVRVALKVEGWLGFRSNKISMVKKAATAAPLEFPGYARLMWHVLTAYDRYRAYQKARRFATNGGLVICDRYPLPQIELMDGASIEQMVNPESTNRLVNFMIKLEKKYYQHIMLPDLLIVLKIDPEIAVQRKTDEDAAYVRIRNQQIWALDWKRLPVHVIHAGQPRADVLNQIKSLVWSRL